MNDNKNRFEKNGEGTYLCPVYGVKSANNKKKLIASSINGKSKAPYYFKGQLRNGDVSIR